MEFNQFSKVIYAQYCKMTKGELFMVNVDVDNLFERYLVAYPAGSNPMYRKRAVHDCQCCKHFIKRLGILVGFDSGRVTTIWDDPMNELGEPYKTVARIMAGIIRQSPIKCVFRSREKSFGVDHNYDEKMERYEHFHGEVSASHFAVDPEAKRGEQDAIYQVMYRGLTELKMPHFVDVLGLIDANELYKGAEFKPAVVGFMGLLKDFGDVSGANEADRIINQQNFVWANLSNRNARFRNTAIGNLFVELAEGKDLDAAVRSYESNVAPMNYKRPTTVITQRMIEDAVQTLTTLGLGGAIYRRFANFTDVSINDVLFVDNSVKMKDSITQLLESSVKAPNVFHFEKNALPVTADHFVKEVLPGAKSVELFLTNRHTGNFVSLTAPKDNGDYRLFKWNNNFAWSYDGDVTDSVKQRVKAAGGNIEALLRVSLSWYNFDDLDIHCILPNKEEVYYNNRMGILDVDMNAGSGKTRNAVENLAFNKLIDGEYKVFVHQYQRRESVDIGFAIEIEYGGIINQYSYASVVKDKVPCFNLTVKGGKLIKTEADKALVGGNISTEKWGVKTETLVPITCVMNSPNHWGGESVGAKHLIFGLKGCKNPDPVRGIYNEYLRSDFEKHRKVFEVLGAKSKCQVEDGQGQISGVGFSSARGDSVIIICSDDKGRRSYTLSF